MNVIHWAMPNDERALCRSISQIRCTTIKYVTCDYCRNVIDRWLHEHMPEPAEPQDPKPDNVK